MSKDWDVHCVTCDEGLGLYDGNHQEAAVNRIVARKDELATIADLFVDATQTFEFYGAGTVFDTSWFVKHKSHDIRARSEYGDYSGVCGEHAPCDACGKSGYCNREPGHSGAHQEKPEPK